MENLLNNTDYLSRQPYLDLLKSIISNQQNNPSGYSFAIYVYYTTKQFDFSSMNTGTGVPSMTSVIIRGLPIIQPFQQILDKFDNIVQGFYKQIHKNEKETAKRTNLRDHLLPLLMNGQVEVGTNNSSAFCNAKLGKQATACDMNGQVEVEVM